MITNTERRRLKIKMMDTKTTLVDFANQLGISKQYVCNVVNQKNSNERIETFLRLWLKENSKEKK